MKRVFADTYYFLAAVNTRETDHQAALACEALTGDQHFAQAGFSTRLG